MSTQPSLDPDSASRSARGLLLSIVGLALAAAVLSELGWGGERAISLPWQAFTLSVLALPLVLGGGAALGPLLFATPTVEPSPLKLGLFASALSPALTAALWYGLAFGLELPPARAWSITFLLIGALALLGWRKPISAAPAGRAAGIAVLLGLAAAVAACAVVWSQAGLAARLGSNETIAQAGLAQSLQDGAPLQNAWISGLPLALRPALAAWLVAASGPAGLLPLFSIGFVMGWSAFVLAIAGYLASAALFRETTAQRAGLRDAVAAAAVLLVAAALDGGRWSVGRWLSMAYTLTFVVAALHAVRRGARPWPGLACLVLTVIGLLHPTLAAAVLVPFGLSALLMRRWNLAPLAVLAVLPGFLVARMYGGFAFEQALPYLAPPRSVRGEFGGMLDWSLGWALEEHFWPRRSIIGWVPLALGGMAFVGLVVRGRRDPDDARVSRSGGVLALLLVAALITAGGWLPSDVSREAQGLAGAAFLLASLGLGRVAQWVPSRAGGALLALGLLGWLAVPVWRDRAEAPRAEFPFEERPWGLAVTVDRPLEEGLGAALEYLRESPFASDPSAILLREPGPLGPVRRDEPLSMTPLLSGLGLWGGRASSPGTDQPRAFAPPRPEPRTDLGDTPIERRELLEALFEQESQWGQRFVRVLEAARKRGHTLLFVVTEADRRSTTDRGEGPRGVDDAIRRMGAEEVFQEANTSVYLLPVLAPGAP
ncbi:hypothetical protein [Planctomycetes bacterium Poly30]